MSLLRRDCLFVVWTCKTQLGVRCFYARCLRQQYEAAAAVASISTTAGMVMQGRAGQQAGVMHVQQLTVQTVPCREKGCSINS
jgi:hypothetical protein